MYATGRFVLLLLLRALEYEWHLPATAGREVKYIRQPDPDDPTRLVPAEIDLRPALDAGVLRGCDCRDDAELELYVELAARIRDDGESMGLAIAKCRGRPIVTDDRKARRIAGELGIAILSTPEIMKAWAVATSATDVEVVEVLRNTQTFARFTPNPTLPEFDWWVTAIGGPSG
jgi:hypothetical protein